MAKGLIRSAFIGKNIFTQYINKGDGSKQKTLQKIFHTTFQYSIRLQDML